MSTPFATVIGEIPITLTISALSVIAVMPPAFLA